MTRSRIMDIIKNVVAEKKIDLTSFGWQRIRDIERALDRGELKKEDVAGKLALDSNLRFKLDRNDYKKIEDQLRRNGL